MVPFTCPCGKFYHVADESQGHQVRCPFCYKIRDVPAPPPPPASPRRARRLRGPWRNALSLAALALAVPIGGPTLIWIATLTQVAPASTPTDVAKAADSAEDWGASSEPEAKLSLSPSPPPPPPPTPDPPQPAIVAEAAEPPPAPPPTPLRPNLAPGAYGVLRSPLYDSVTICDRWQKYSEHVTDTLSPTSPKKRDSFTVSCDQRRFLSGGIDRVPNGTPIKILERRIVEVLHFDRRHPEKKGEYLRPHSLFQIQITGGPHNRCVAYVAAEYIDPGSLSDQPLAYNPEPPNPAQRTLDHPSNLPRWVKACPPLFPPWYLEEGRIERERLKLESASHSGRR